MKELQPIEVAAAVIFRCNKLLICSRPPDKPPAGWEFPGGKKEQGETYEESLKREVLEELGVQIIVLDVLGKARSVVHGGGRSVEIVFFRATLDSGSDKLEMRENQSAEWIDPADILDYDILPADREIAGYLSRF